MASPTQWTWIWVNSVSWWWTGRPGMLQFMGLQRVRHDWATELNRTELNGYIILLKDVPSPFPSCFTICWGEASFMRLEWCVCVDICLCVCCQLQIGTCQEHCQWLNNRGICHLPLQRLNPVLCSYWPSTPAKGVQGRVSHSLFQGIWWDRSLDRWVFLGTDFMISILASPHI